MNINLKNGYIKIHGVPEGQDARYLKYLAQESWDISRSVVMHIVSDNDRLLRLHEYLSFFAPEMNIIAMPSWDCLPYDRVSPTADNLSKRVKAFYQLSCLDQLQSPTIVIASLQAAIQKIPSLDYYKDALFEVAVKQKIDQNQLKNFLEMQSYLRVSIVKEQGEYAVRGSIIDIFPFGSDLPIRIDFFDTEIDTIKIFEPHEQKSIETIDKFELLSAQEIILNKNSIALFRSRYRELFGVPNEDDTLYHSVVEGRKYTGLEHWLPLFFDDMTDLFSVIPERTVLCLDHQYQAIYKEKTNEIIDFYHSRLDFLKDETKKKASHSNPYHPIPPTLLYLQEDTWQHRINRQIVRELVPFSSEDAAEFDMKGRIVKNFSAINYSDVTQLYKNIHEFIQENSNKKIVIACYTKNSTDRIKNIFQEHSIINKNIEFTEFKIEHGFVSDDLIVISEQDILGDKLSRSPTIVKRNKNAIFNVSELQQGDYVVHIEHGIGQFTSLVTIPVNDVLHDCVCILYANNDKLFLPVENLDVISRYGSEQSEVQLDRLGGTGWQSRKAKIKKKLLDMAEGLVKIAAQRLTVNAPEIEIPDGSYQEFVARFPFQETDDQEKAIADVLGDLGNDHAMDRLVCGDVGFGKTEVAMRAAFVAAMSGLQVAIVVPTTLLARQHYNNFVKRFKGFPLRIAQLSRMVTTRDAAINRDLLSSGKIDIIIGTHALLSDKVKFNNLGLLIVDEEQNFGVKQKEKLKNLKENVHVLTLTATPIPRTLQMAVSGIRELSLITTPPIDRLAVRTSVIPFDPVIVREAILREIHRSGQIFYVCPRLSEIDELQTMLYELVPEIKIVQAHGQMTATDLDERMTAFYEGEYHLLLATNIIESGLDIPNANTLIIHRSELFGLSQLYQMRGRIGRSKVRGYAYFTYRDEALLTESAKQRLQVISSLDNLGAGFQLASYDMDIRGSGNLLGEEQSGHIKEVGAELYQQMLEDAMQAVRTGNKEDSIDENWVPTINLGIAVLIPDTYIQDLPVRLSLYRRLASLSYIAEIEEFSNEMIDRFGNYPDEVKNLLNTISIKHLCKMAGIERFDAGPKGAVITFKNNQFDSLDGLLDYIKQQSGTLKFRPDQKLVLLRSWDDLSVRLKGVNQVLSDLVKIKQMREQ